MLEWLQMPGSVDMLVSLLNDDHFISWFYRSPHNPQGIGSSHTVLKLRAAFTEVGLVREYEKQQPLGGSRIYLTLTKKGRRVAEHLRSIADLVAGESGARGEVRPGED